MLRTAARQQEAVAHLGQQALAGALIPSLLDTAIGLVARGLEVEFSEIFEFQPERRHLVLRAATGWRDGRVGRAAISADVGTLGGYVLSAPGPVVVEDAARETRFEVPSLLREHGVASGISVVISGKERPFGVLSAHATRPREFTTPEVLFVQAVAHVLATSIDRALAQEAVRRSEEHFRSLIENSSDIVTIITDDGIFRYLSPSVERLLGYRASDLLGLTAFEFMHPDDLADVLEAIQLAIERPGTTQAARFRFRHKDGQWRVLESVGQARRDGPNAYSIVVNSRDITERERQEQALRASKERLRTVVAGAPVILFALDDKGVFTFAEGKGLDVLGVRPGQLAGSSIFQLFQDVPQAVAEIRRALRGESFTSTLEVFGLEFEASYSPLRNRSGEVVGVIGVATDITERRRAEQALARSDEANRLLVRQAPYGIFRASPEGQFVAANPVLVEMLGYDAEPQLLEGTLATDVYVDARERTEYLARLGEETRAVSTEVTWRRRDAERIRVRLYGRAVRHSDGRIDCFEVFAEDVSERRALEDQLRQSQKMEALGQLTGGIAHDFNNLLTVILANAELLQKGLPADSHGQQDVRDIVSAAVSGRIMVNQLLGFSRRSALNLETVHVGHAVTGLADVLRRVLPADIEMVVLADGDLPDVQADLHAVEQILFNLVNNARDAMPEGGVLRMETSCTWLNEEQRGLLGPAAQHEYVCLAVDDTGMGMDEATRQRVFEPFFTTKPAGKGTGLGMATVYGLVRQHGGFVQVDSAVGMGTRVRVYFPVAEGRVRAEKALASAEPVVGGDETVLVVEDQTPLRRATIRTLEDAGYRVIAAGDGQEGLELLRTAAEPIHLVVTDIVMPRLGGRALYDAARREGKTVPFLFASGWVGADRRNREPLDPSLPFIRKPWASADLLRTVRELLDRPTPPALSEPTPPA
ncbi:MAG TPA: PAS domain S-box protein [Gemmatimonadales bacterium]